MSKQKQIMVCLEHLPVKHRNIVKKRPFNQLPLQMKRLVSIRHNPLLNTISEHTLAISGA